MSGNLFKIHARPLQSALERNGVLSTDEGTEGFKSVSRPEFESDLLSEHARDVKTFNSHAQVFCGFRIHSNRSFDASN
jgi:hypothetical protein